MTTKHRFLAILAVLLATAVSGTVALAQEGRTQAPQTPASQTAPMAGQGMMPGEGMMGKDGMMGQMDMAQMNKMMENCDRMMQSHMDRHNLDKPGQQPSGNRG